MNLYGISNILTGIASLSMAIFVYIKGYKHRLARLWSLFALSAALYGFGAYMVTLAKNPDEALFWWRVAYVGIILLPFLFVLLVYEFLNIKHSVFIKFISLLTGLFLIANFFFKKLFLNNCTLYFTEMKRVTPIYFIYPPGPLLVFFIIFAFFGWVAYAHFELLSNYKEVSGLKRNQLKYFFFAAALGFAGGGTSFLPCFGISFYPVFNFTVPFYFFIVSYAILRYRLMDVRVVITRSGIFVALYSLLLGAPYAFALRFKSLLVELYGINWWMVPTGLMAISATFGPFIYIYLERKAEKRLLSEQSKYQETLKQAAREMARVRNFKKLLNLIVHTVTKTVRIAYSAIYLSEPESDEFILKASHSIKKTQPLSISKENPLVSWFQNHREPLVHEEISRQADQSPKPVLRQIAEEMLLLHAAVIVPGFLEDNLIGILVLGDKRTRGTYTSEDLNTFSLLANQAALAIENALLYGNMEEQVRERTKELVDVQRQLIQAEKLATVGTLAGGVAHEINNPLTAILTNVQMLLAAEEVDAHLDRESLELIEEATKRCRTIVQKLMTYARKPLEDTQVSRVNLSVAVKNVASFLQYQLEQDNIRIIVEAKEKEYPVMGNQNELEQVLTNIILNARDAIKQIKRSGNIHVSLVKNNDGVKISIEDEGPGIPKEIIPKIFDPFFTTKDVGKGTGLGLSICQAIAEKHRGKISVQSQAQRGTTFIIQLPAVKIESGVKVKA
ncbi:MAG: ATP-binding protein [Candidatus Omnitrophota bacterium]|jgi:signal transduction histidine kinase